MASKIDFNPARGLDGAPVPVVIVNGFVAIEAFLLEGVLYVASGSTRDETEARIAAARAAISTKADPSQDGDAT